MQSIDEHVNTLVQAKTLVVFTFCCFSSLPVFAGLEVCKARINMFGIDCNFISVIEALAILFGDLVIDNLHETRKIGFAIIVNGAFSFEILLVEFVSEAVMIEFLIFEGYFCERRVYRCMRDGLEMDRLSWKQAAFRVWLVTLLQTDQELVIDGFGLDLTHSL